MNSQVELPCARSPKPRPSDGGRYSCVDSSGTACRVHTHADEPLTRHETVPGSRTDRAARDSFRWRCGSCSRWSRGWSPASTPPCLQNEHTTTLRLTRARNSTKQQRLARTRGGRPAIVLGLSNGSAVLIAPRRRIVVHATLNATITNQVELLSLDPVHAAVWLTARAAERRWMPSFRTPTPRSAGSSAARERNHTVDQRATKEA